MVGSRPGGRHHCLPCCCSRLVILLSQGCGQLRLQECRRYFRRRDAAHRYVLSIRPGGRQHHRRQRRGIELQPSCAWRTCSSTAARTTNGKRHLVLQRFRQACVFHDLCYRHGLATYGYNQNDCDRVLQNAGFPAVPVFPQRQGDRTKRRAARPIRNWFWRGSALAAPTPIAPGTVRPISNSSRTLRSNGFSVSRVVDHPFKSVDPEKYRDDPDQVILTFENIRSNLTVTCVTCKEVPVLETDRRSLRRQRRNCDRSGSRNFPTPC